MSKSDQPATGHEITYERPSFQSRSKLFIDGRWITAEGDGDTAVLDSATEALVGDVGAATFDQLDSAVHAAQRAQLPWSSLSGAARAEHLNRLHQQLLPRAKELTELISVEVGTPARLGRSVQVGVALSVLAFYAELLPRLDFEERLGNALIVREPVGVVGAITPWNYPLHQAIAKVAAALAAGATVVHKPSGLAPLTAFVLAEAVEAAELPAGVYNLVTGSGEKIGGAMARHPGIDMISFTGSTSAGVNVGETAIQSVKRLALELGGKSASVVLEDANLQRAVTASVNNAFLNSGQTCDAWTRLIVPHDRLADVVDIALEAAARLRVGDPFDERTRLGPLVSQHQIEQVRWYVSAGISGGSRLVLGGPEPPPDFPSGFYFQPTIFVDVTPDTLIAREEIFGPVLAILTYQDEDDALQIANATEYGLGGAVWSADNERAIRFARRMRSGQVHINGGRFNLGAPFGGVRRSGVGRELGRYGLEEFLELKALLLNENPLPQ